MMTACMPLSRKYSPMVQPVNGARYCIGAGSDAVAAITMEYSRAPCSSSTFTNWATVERFWPIATYTQYSLIFSSGCAFSGFWFRMVSSAIAVLPVWRSPMISSRWPRPTGISASIGLEAGRHRLMHRLAWNDAGRLDVDALALDALDRALAVDRIAERVDHAAQQALADGSVDDGAGALDGLAFLDLAVGAEDHDADVVGFEIERHTARAVLELDHFTGLDVVEAIDTSDAVTNRQHLTDFRDLGFLAEILDLVLENCGNFRGADVHQPASFIACLIELSLVRSELSTMRLPSLTTSPPMIAGSTFTLRATSLPVTRLQRGLEGVEILVAERLGDGDVGGDFALEAGHQLVEGARSRHARQTAGDSR